MKRLFLIFVLMARFYLCMCIIVNAQTKPRNPLAPTGLWATNLVRAYAFSRLDSIRVDSVKDWSTNNAWGIINLSQATQWTAQSGESPKYSTVGTNSPSGAALEFININPIFSFTNQLTIAQRLRLSCNGSCGGSFGITNRVLSPPTTLRFSNNVGFANIAEWCMNNGSENCRSPNLGGASAFTTTIILTYAGDSLRIYQDTVYRGAVAQTGNVTTSGYVMALGLVARGDGTVYDSWTGGFLMTCIWSRVLSSSERTQIFSDPYVMFKEAVSSGAAGTWSGRWGSSNGRGEAWGQHKQP